jgi:hypothetical protein
MAGWTWWFAERRWRRAIWEAHGREIHALAGAWGTAPLAARLGWALVRPDQLVVFAGGLWGAHTSVTLAGVARRYEGLLTASQIQSLVEPPRP